MRFRAFRVRGQDVETVIRTGRDRFSVPAAAHAADIARAYGAALADVEVRESDTPPVLVAPRPEPPQPQLAPPDPAERVGAIEPALRAALLTLLDLVNVERAEHARPAVTPEQFVAAVRGRL